MNSSEIELTVQRANLQAMQEHATAMASNIAAIERRIAELEFLRNVTEAAKGVALLVAGESEEDRTDRILSEKAEHEAEADRAERRDDAMLKERNLCTGAQ